MPSFPNPPSAFKPPPRMAQLHNRTWATRHSNSVATCVRAPGPRDNRCGPDICQNHSLAMSTSAGTCCFPFDRRLPFWLPFRFRFVFRFHSGFRCLFCFRSGFRFPLWYLLLLCSLANHADGIQNIQNGTGAMHLACRFSVSGECQVFRFGFRFRPRPRRSHLNRVKKGIPSGSPQMASHKREMLGPPWPQT